MCMKPNGDFKVVILAAGRGSRLKNLTKDIPKCLLEVQGKSLIQRQFESFAKSGLSNSEISVVTGYLSTKLNGLDVKKFHNSAWSSTNMVYSLLQATEWLEKYNCIISYSDIFYTSSAIKSLMRSSYDFAVTYDPNWLNLWRSRFKNPLSDAESFILNSDGTLQCIGRKVKDVAQITGQYMGLIKITPQRWRNVIKFLSSQEHNFVANLSFTDLFQILIENRNELIGAVPYLDIWGEVDSEKDLNLYNDLTIFPKL